MRCVLWSIFVPLLVACSVCSAFCQQSSSSNRSCTEAQILTIKGSWIANPDRPTRRALKQWSCVAGGDQLTLADGSPAGEITVIYHDGSLEPYTKSCPASGCRNAYEVEKPKTQTSRRRPPYQGVLDFFFSIFSEPEPEPKPGILRGSAVPAPPHAVVCEVEGQIDLKQSLRSDSDRRRFGFVTSVFRPIWHRFNQTPTIQYQPMKLEHSTGNFENEGNTVIDSTSSTSMVLDEPLEGPTLYQLEPRSKAGLHKDNVLVLATPKDQYNALSHSYDEAFELTKTWKHISREAVSTFRSLYLVGLAKKSGR